MARPSQAQREAFQKLTFEERFNWHMDMLALCHELAPKEARENWHRRQTKPHESK